MNIDECARKPCQRGRCVNQDGGYKCTCSRGWRGQNCQKVATDCNAESCLHGDCGNKDGGYKCTCRQGWPGQNCNRDPYDWARKGSTRYKVFLERKSYTAAQQTCAQNRGLLAVIKTEAVYKFLLTLIRRADPRRDYWFGMNNLANGNKWMWLDGTPLDDCSFRKWAPGEPNKQQPYQNCAHLWAARGHQWDDQYCDGQYGEASFVCQIGPGEDCDKGGDGYTSLGCWQDTYDKLLPSLEGADPRLDGHFFYRQNGIEKCYQVALSRGFTVFGVTYGGACVGSADGHNKYMKRRRTTGCTRDGKGGHMAIEVYQITAPRVRCKQGWSKYKQHCYWLGRGSPVDWPRARSLCERHGADLASIKDADENNFITSLISNGGQ
ncbi:neurocan core protein-like [Branchiostoma floridae]|uniref:Neurocan core protein-like n=1 Tax=Branchiostoma floridae TaxID=7739 RepID=A0A9J7M8F7_BRAFL|nr:neurocan core protein-like [Branchiostoma floridae]